MKRAARAVAVRPAAPWSGSGSIGGRGRKRMKGMGILMGLLAIGCGSPGQPQEASPDHASVASPAAYVPPHRQGRYRLVGLPTGPRIFFNQARCLRTLHTYAAAMEAGLGAGSSSQLRCEPE